ncbi:hypothetical protein [Streptomyces jumonjinensis]|uniref:hypothetical protein n=1 Tax=Streptomyces jumonjinensis TaxID=1945 RepID=UPI0037B9F202
MPGRGDGGVGDPQQVGGDRAHALVSAVLEVLPVAVRGVALGDSGVRSGAADFPA